MKIVQSVQGLYNGLPWWSNRVGLEQKPSSVSEALKAAGRSLTTLQYKNVILADIRAANLMRGEINVFEYDYKNGAFGITYRDKATNDGGTIRFDSGFMGCLFVSHPLLREKGELVEKIVRTGDPEFHKMMSTIGICVRPDYPVGQPAHVMRKAFH